MGGLFAQSILGSGGRRWTKYQTYGPKDRPPLALTEAYTLAVARLGPATNRFHCISASVLEMGGTNGWTGWTFWFSNTNGDRASMWVFFDGGVTCDFRSGEGFKK